MVDKTTQPNGDELAATPPVKPTGGRRLRRILRRTALVVLGFLSVILLVLCVVIGALQTDWGRGLLVRTLMPVLNDIFAGTLEVDRVDGPVLGRLVLEGVRLKTPDGTVAASVGRAEVKYNIWPLLNQTVELTDIRVSNVEALILDPMGRVTFAEVFRPETPSEPSGTQSPWVVRIGTIHVDKSHVRLNTSPDSPTLNDTKITMGLTVENGGIGWDNVTLRATPENLPITTFYMETAGHFGESALTLERFVCNADPFAVELFGSLTDLGVPGGPTFDVTFVDVSAQLGELERLFSAPPLLGMAHVSGTVTGALSALNMAIGVRSAGGVVSVRGTVGIHDGITLDTTVYSPAVGPGLVWPVLPEELSFGLNTRVAGNWTSLTQHELRAGVVISDLRTPIAHAESVGVTAVTHDGDWTVTTEVAGPGSQTVNVVAHGDHLLPPIQLAAEWAITDMDLAFWASTFGLPPISGVLDAVNGRGTATLAMDTPPKVDAQVFVRAHALSVPESVGVKVAVDSAQVDVDVQWAGVGLPDATVDLALSGIVAAGAQVDALDAKLTANAGAEGVLTTGVIGVRDVNYPEVVRAKALDVGLDLLLDPKTYLPAGKVRIDGVDLSTPDLSLAQVNITTDVDLDQGDIRWNGVASLVQFQQGGGQNAVVVGQTTAKLKGKRTATGSIDTSADITLRTIRAAQTRIKQAHTRLDVDVLTAPELSVTARGNIDAAGLRITPELSIETIRGTVLGGVKGKRPRGFVDATATSIVTGDLTVPKLNFNAELATNGEVTFGLSSAEKLLTALIRGRLTLPKGPSSPLVVEVLEASVSREGAGFVLTPGAKAIIGPKKALGVSGLEIRGQGTLTGQITAAATTDLGSGRVDASVVVQEVMIDQWAKSALSLIGRPVPDFEFAGQLNADIRLNESLRTPTAEFSVSLQNGVLGDLRNVAITSSGTLAPGAFKMKAALGFDPLGTLDADVSLPLDVSLMPFRLKIKPDEPLKATVSLQSIHLADFNKFVPTINDGLPLSGTLTASVRAGGTLNSPLVDAMITGQDIDVGRISGGKINGQLAITPDLSRLDFRVVDTDGELIRLRGNLPLNLAEVFSTDNILDTLIERIGVAPADLSLVIHSIRLGKIPFWLDPLDPIADVRAAANIAISGTLLEPQVHGWAAAQRIPMPGGGVGSALVRMDSIGEDVVTTVGLSAWDQQLVDAMVYVPRPGDIMRGRAPLDWLNDELFVVQAAITGGATELLGTVSPGLASTLDQAIPGAFVDLTATVRGTKEGPVGWILARLEATAAPPREAITFARAILAQIQLDPDGVRTSVAIEQFPNGYLTLDGGLDLSVRALLAGQRPDFTALPIRGRLTSTDFLFSGISALAPAIFGPSTGTFDADVQLSGTVTRPELNGRLVAQFSKLDIVIAGIVEKDIELTLNITPEKIVLEPLHLQSSGKGTMDIAMELEVASLKPEDIYLSGDITLDRFRIARRQDMQITLTGDILLSGNLASPTVQGQLEVTDAQISPDLGGRAVQVVGTPDDVTFLLPSGQIPRGAFGRTTRTNTTGGLNMMLTLDIPPRSVWVKDDMVDLLIGGDMTVKAVNGKMMITGMIEVLEGTVMLYGRKFTLSPDSRITFGGGEEINPDLNIMANYDISSVDLSAIGLQTTDSSAVSVRVSGTAKNPRVELLSSPSMDETNIVAIVVTGTPVGAGQSQQSSLEAQTLNLFVGLATGQVTKLMQSELPIDVFRLQSSEDFTEAQVTVGKRLTRDLMLLYNANLGAPPGQNANEFRVEYTITRTLQLETRFGDAGEGGLDLIFRWRY